MDQTKLKKLDAIKKAPEDIQNLLAAGSDAETSLTIIAGNYQLTPDQARGVAKATADVLLNLLAADQLRDELVKIIPDNIKATAVLSDIKKEIFGRVWNSLKQLQPVSILLTGPAPIPTFTIQRPLETWRLDDNKDIVSEKPRPVPPRDILEKMAKGVTKNPLSKSPAAPQNNPGGASSVSLPGSDRKPLEWPATSAPKPAGTFVDTKLNSIVTTPRTEKSDGMPAPQKPPQPKPDYGGADPYREPPK